MPIIKGNDIIFDRDEPFDARAVCECGQLFRYRQEGGDFVITTGDKVCRIIPAERHTIIQSGDAEYFWNYFDCETDYAALADKLRGKPLIDSALSAGASGIRILRQEKFETLISFIISANNNIPRIKKSIEKICGGGAFPSPKRLAQKSVTELEACGVGYRAPYIRATAEKVASGEINLDALVPLDTPELIKSLLPIKGVGPKVADCIALFGYARPDVFPVDTWVEKVYFDLFDVNDKPRVIRQRLTEQYYPAASLAQQYLFYYKRSLEGK